MVERQSIHRNHQPGQKHGCMDGCRPTFSGHFEHIKAKISLLSILKIF